MFWNRLEKRNLKYKDLKNFSWGSISNINTQEDVLKETTYFKCIKYISESIAKCPIILKQTTDIGEVEAYRHSLYNKLRLRPNPYMSAIDCIQSFIALGEHEGISGLFIDRNTMNLYPAQIQQIIVDDMGICSSKNHQKVLIQFNLINESNYCFEENMILYKSGLTFDGINTHANKTLLNNTIQTNIKSQNYLGKLFDNGLTNKIVIQLMSDIEDEKELMRIKEKFDRIYNSEGRSFTVPAGYKVSPLNLTLADAQFEQLRKLSRREIANCFGLSPVQIGDLEDSNNNNMEMQNLSFLTDTLLFKFQQIEQELNWKYLSKQDREEGYKCEIKQGVILRTDPQTQKNIICDYVKNGVYSLEYARKLLGVAFDKNKETVTLPSGQILLEDLKNGKASWQKKEGEKD